MNPFKQHIQNDLNGLQWLHKFGWLRTREIGQLLWPRSASARHQGDRLARSWLKRRLVLARELPDRAGRALVIATAGVRLLNEYGFPASSGKDIGEMRGEVWTPPLTWRHDLLAARVLVDLHGDGFEVLPERHLRQHVGWMAKLPDGIATRDKKVVWLEIEGARKTGAAMRQLAQALAIVASGEAVAVLGHRPTHPMVAYIAGATDDRGYALNHQMRVRRAVAEAARNDVQITWAQCTSCSGVDSDTVTYISETIGADKAAKVRRVLDAGGWREHDGCLVGNYGKHQVRVWKDDEPEAWGWEAVGKANRVGSREAAKQACASALAAL